MKNIFKSFIGFFMVSIGIFFINNINVNASNSIPTRENTLSLMNMSINITNGMYDEYTDSEQEIGWANFYGVNIYNYYQEDYGFCGFYMDYTKKSQLFGTIKGKATIHGDDPIVYLVPKELFIHRGTYTYVGREYGFFVNTREYANSGELETANLVDVFIFDIITSYNSKDEIYTYTIKPLYTFTFIYLSEYIFYTQSEITIDNVKLSLDSENYSTYSDVVIPIPRMSKDKVSNQYGSTYVQDYDETQPNKDLYVIKDTMAFVNLVNANNKNSFDSDYEIEKDEGYRIRRSYTQFSGYSVNNPNVSYSNLIGTGINSIANVVGIFYPTYGMTYTITTTILDLFSEIINVETSSKMGCEMQTLTNNPSDLDKGGKYEQRSWYTSRGYDEQYWKMDAKQITSSSNNALIFKNLKLDNFGSPVYNSITYHWHLESESKERAYLTYGSSIQIAKLNLENNSYDEVSIGKSEYYILIGNEISKDISIFTSTEGYMLKNGEYDTFSFNPKYSGYYKFTTRSYAKIYLFENDDLVRGGIGSLYYIFDKNKNYKFEVIIGSFPQKSRVYDVSIEPLKFSDTNCYKLDNFIKKDSDTGLLKIHCPQDNIYNLELYSTVNHLKKAIGFSVYDDNMELIQKYFINNYQNNAESVNEQCGIILNLKKDTCYYIIFDIDYEDNVYLEWNNLNEKYELNKDYSLNANIGDKFSYIDIPYDSRYKISFEYLNSDLLYSNTCFMLIKYSNNSLSVEFCVICSESSGNIVKEINLLKGDKIYFGYFNGINSINYNFLVIEHPLYEFTITTETNEATETTGLGTEITVNNGLRYDNTIAVGFTRVLYLSSDAKYKSRYNDYIWSSSDTSIATVSAYGTVFAKDEGTVIIRVIDKYGQNHVATITIQVYIKESQNYFIELSTDVNENPELNGTEVRLNGGFPNQNIIHIGYTRSICIISGGPTNIRQDYDWSSSDTSIAYVDQYGIVHAVATGTVIITCVNKYNSSYIGKITIIVES